MGEWGYLKRELPISQFEEVSPGEADFKRATKVLSL